MHQIRFKFAIATFFQILFLSSHVVGEELITLFPASNTDSSCFKKVTPDIQDGVEFLRIAPNSWHDGRLILSCMLGYRPNLGELEFLTFQARVTGPLLEDGGSCEPKIQMKGGPHPRFLSHTVLLKGSTNVENGELNDLDWRTVVIPKSALTTTDWPDLDEVAEIRFLRCSGFSGYQYHIRNIEMTNSPPIIGFSDDSVSPNDDDSMPSQSPIGMIRSDINIYSNLSDGFAIESNEKSCLFDYATQTSGYDRDYIEVATNKWHSGGVSFGCLETSSNGDCIHSCFDNGTRPDLSRRDFLTFVAKVPNNFELGSECSPRLKIYGNGSPAKESNTIILEGTYVDEGYLNSDEWRNVVIPLVDLQNSWDLKSGVKSLRFLTCGESRNPIYQIADLRLTDYPPATITMAPSSTPSVRVTSPPSEATHRWYNQDWFPILDRSDPSFKNSDTNEFPTNVIDGDSIIIPSGSQVIYSSGQQLSAKLNYLVVEGTLIITPQEGNISFTASTILVEEGGTLIIESTPMHSVEIEFDGSIDRESDPTEMMNGLVSLGGYVRIEGEPVCLKMETILVAIQGESSITVKDQIALECWKVGDELYLPDTQAGLDTSHWGFVPDNYNPEVSQLESITILEIIAAGDNTLIILESPLLHDHMEGAHAAFVTRSVVLRTSDESIDRGHILHTGHGSFDVYNTMIENMGRSTVDEFDSAVIVDSGVNFESGLAKMITISHGTNQIARYALHAHHSLVPMEFIGNVVLDSPRFGIVAHNSRVNIRHNVVIAAAGSGILLEDGTETGDVMYNLIVGNGGGSGGDDRFTPSEGTDIAHGGFGIWSRTIYSKIENNFVEGVYGLSAYGFFLHINFMKDRRVPNIMGTPEELIGKTRPEVESNYNDQLTLQTFGSFALNHAFGSWRSALDVKYSFGTSVHGGHVFNDFNVVALASSGAAFTFSHAATSTIESGTFLASYLNNQITGVKCHESGYIYTSGYVFDNVAGFQEGCNIR